MTFQSRLSALLGLAIVSLCNIALVNAGDENTVYAIHANLCTYQKRNRWHNEVKLLKNEPRVIQVPIGQTCAISYNKEDRQWYCKAADNSTTSEDNSTTSEDNSTTSEDNSTTSEDNSPTSEDNTITIIRTKDPHSGKVFKNIGGRSKKGAVYIVADTLAGGDLVWAFGSGFVKYAVISHVDNQAFLCIKENSSHPQIFPVTLLVPAVVGTRTKGRLGKGTFGTETDAYNYELYIPSKPSALYLRVFELNYEGEAGSGQWKIRDYFDYVDANMVVGRGIAIKAVKGKTTKTPLTFSLVKASSWPPNHAGKNTVAYIIPSKTTKVFFQHGKAKFYYEKKTDSTNTQARPAINITLKKRIEASPTADSDADLDSRPGEGIERI